MKTSAKGIALIKSFEGCRLTAYQDSVGVWTIGYGITTAAGLGPVVKGMVITQQQADDMFTVSLAPYEAAVSKALTRSPNQNQFDAMVSLCFNIGPNGFKGSSVVRHFNAGDSVTAAKSFALWNKAEGKVLAGLTRRREAEANLFLTPIAAHPVVVQGDLMVLPPDVEPVEEGAVKPPATLWEWFRKTFLW